MVNIQIAYLAIVAVGALGILRITGLSSLFSVNLLPQSGKQSFVFKLLRVFVLCRLLDVLILLKDVLGVVAIGAYLSFSLRKLLHFILFFSLLLRYTCRLGDKPTLLDETTQRLHVLLDRLVCVEALQIQPDDANVFFRSRKLTIIFQQIGNLLFIIFRVFI